MATANVILVDGNGNMTAYQAVILVNPGDVQIDLSNYTPKSEAMGCVVHGADPTLPRPLGYSSVTWVGTVRPNNMAQNDIYENTNNH